MKGFSGISADVCLHLKVMICWQGEGDRRGGCPFPWREEKTEIWPLELGVVKIQTAAFLEAGGRHSMGKSFLPLPSVKASAAACSVQSTEENGILALTLLCNMGLVGSYHSSIGGCQSQKTFVVSFEGTETVLCEE